MFLYIWTALAGLSTLWIIKKFISLNRNVAIANASGIPYRMSPMNGVPGYLWMATNSLFLRPLHQYRPSRKWLWPKLFHPHRSWHYSQELREVLGEVYLIVSPDEIFMSSSNAEAIYQLTSRRNDFLKPVEIYAIVDIYGSSILTTEGQEWRRHRKIVAPAFSEKSNSLVWKESCQQTLAMTEVWLKLDGNSPGDMKVNDTAPYTATMALHVISAAGFGVRQLWDGESEEKLGARVVPGFNTSQLIRNHTLTFKDALDTLLHGIMWLAIFPVSFLQKSPLEIHKKLLKAYFECSDYFSELSEYKIEQIERGETEEKGTMDIMGPLVKASQNTPEENGSYLTKQEVIADSFIALFAGHETSANVSHCCLLFLAIYLQRQRHLQKDIDSIVGSRPAAEWTYESDLGKIWNTMVGATINETLRLLPPVVDIPKVVRNKPQSLTYDGKTVTVPKDTIIHMSAVGLHRNPRYWPHSPSKISSKSHDLDEWVPERWLSSNSKTNKNILDNSTVDTRVLEGENATSFDTPDGLFVPVKGSFIPFSEGARSCPGKRFAQVEITAIISVIFNEYSLELDVSEWATDDQVREMGNKEKKLVYEKAMDKALGLISDSQSEIFLKMRGNYPVRFRRRGEEMFAGVF